MSDLERSAASLDLDGVVFPRFPAQLAVLKPWAYHSPIKPGEPITRVHRESPVEDVLEEHFKGDFKRHAGRKVKPEAAEFVRSLQVDAIFGNTGRHNHEAWVEMTRDLLEQGGIEDLFTDFYFKPEGWDSDQSKYWALKEIAEMGYRFTHYDDNARTIRRLAPEFPDHRFVIVQDLTSGILFSRREMQRHPNVMRMAIRKNGQINVTHMSPNFGDLA